MARTKEGRGAEWAPVLGGWEGGEAEGKGKGECSKEDEGRGWAHRAGQRGRRRGGGRGCERQRVRAEGTGGEMTVEAENVGNGGRERENVAARAQRAAADSAAVGTGAR